MKGCEHFMSSSIATGKNGGVFLDIECRASREDAAKLELYMLYLKGLYVYAFSKLFHDYRYIDREKIKENLVKNYPSRDKDIIDFFDRNMFDIEKNFKYVSINNVRYKVRFDPIEVPDRIKERTVYYAGNDLYILFDRYISWLDVNKTTIHGLPEFVDAKIFLESNSTHAYMYSSKYSWHFNVKYPHIYQENKMHGINYLIHGKLRKIRRKDPADFQELYYDSGMYDIAPGEYILQKSKIMLMSIHRYDIVRLEQYLEEDKYKVQHINVKSTNLNVGKLGRVYNLNIHLVETKDTPKDQPPRLMYTHVGARSLSRIRNKYEAFHDKSTEGWWDYPDDYYDE